MIYIFAGDGKGKTSAAIGSLTRAYGAGITCAIIFFDKNERFCNELKSLKKLGIENYIFGENRTTFVIPDGASKESVDPGSRFRFENNQKDIDEAEKALEKAIELSKKVEFLVLDELLNAIRTNLLKLDKVLEFLDDFPKEKYLIITGRGLPKEIEARADLISEIKKIKHPFDNNISAQKGIDF